MEAAYLRQMFKYRILTPVAETKVRSLLQQYKPLVGIDKAFVEALIEREGCPDYWTKVKPQCSPQMIAEASCNNDPDCSKCWEEVTK